MLVLAIDIGYGDCKVVLGNSLGITKIYKFISAVAEVKVNDMVTDNRVINYLGSNYYVGQDALQVQSSSIIDISEYSKLEFFSPLFVYRVLEDLQAVPDTIVLGLSIAQITNSGHFKKNIEEFLRKAGIAANIVVVPQGAIAKLAIDTYGTEFPNTTKDFNSKSSYIIADIGFNTLDVCHVINGTTSSNLVRGIPNRGATLIVQDIIVDIKNKYKIQLNISEGKEALITNTLRRRGTEYDISGIIESAKSSYITNLRNIIESEFGTILDKIDKLILLGGGAYILNPTNDNFVVMPKSGSEYYNAIGMYRHGVK